MISLTTIRLKNYLLLDTDFGDNIESAINNKLLHHALFYIPEHNPAPLAVLLMLNLANEFLGVPKIQFFFNSQGISAIKFRFLLMDTGRP